MLKRVEAAPILRVPSIDSDPHSNAYTIYDFANKSDQNRAVAEIRSVTNNGSFISRSLLMISNNGLSKKFEGITGEDGLTFGVKDFTSGGVFPLLQLIQQQDPQAIQKAFGPLASDVLNRAWLESVEPALAAFKRRNFRTEFSLAAMGGVANSFGPGSDAAGNGMIGRLNAAKALVGSNDEGQIMRAFVRAYAVRDAHKQAEQFAAERLVKIDFGDASGTLPSQDELSHSGRRVLLLFQIFPWKAQRAFTGLGNFVLAADEGAQ